MILKIDHVGIAVRDVAERLAFWRDALGFRSWAPWVLLLQALSPHLRVADNRAWIMDSLWSAFWRAQP